MSDLYSLRNIVCSLSVCLFHSEGFVALSKLSDPVRIEAEVLPPCWEQINHKYAERRLLVAECCAVLAPFVPVS